MLQVISPILGRSTPPVFKREINLAGVYPGRLGTLCSEAPGRPTNIVFFLASVASPKFTGDAAFFPVSKVSPPKHNRPVRTGSPGPAQDRVCCLPPGQQPFGCRPLGVHTVVGQGLRGVDPVLQMRVPPGKPDPQSGLVRGWRPGHRRGARSGLGACCCCCCRCGSLCGCVGKGCCFCCSLGGCCCCGGPGGRFGGSAGG